MTLSILIHRSSDPSTLLIFCVIGFCAGIGLFLYGFRLLQRRRLILDTPFSKIRSASMGMVEVSGLAVGPYTMVAPVTARPCYYYRTLVWEWKQSGKNKTWVKVASECMHLPFFVDDNTGRLLVDPRGADLDLHRDFEEEFMRLLLFNRDDAPGNVRAFSRATALSPPTKSRWKNTASSPRTRCSFWARWEKILALKSARSRSRTRNRSTRSQLMDSRCRSIRFRFPPGGDDAEFHIGSMGNGWQYHTTPALKSFTFHQTPDQRILRT